MARAPPEELALFVVTVQDQVDQVDKVDQVDQVAMPDLTSPSGLLPPHHIDPDTQV